MASKTDRHGDADRSRPAVDPPVDPAAEPGGPPQTVERSDDLLELIFSSAGDGIYGVDTQGRTTFVNPAAGEMLGWDPAELIGTVQHLVSHHSHADGSPYDRTDCPIYAAFSDGRVHRVADEVFWRRDGTSFPVEYTSTPIRREGVLVGAVVTFRDITERLRSQELERERRLREEAARSADELARVAKELERRNAELDQFAYVASHDLKAPLRGIANLSEWIEEDLGDLVEGDTREHLELLRSRVRRMEDLIDGLLAYSRAGRVSDDTETVDTGELVDEVAELLVPPEGAEVTVPDDMPVLETERLPLRQVFHNLVGNGVKFGGRAQDGVPPRVEVGWSSRDGAVRFTVTDNGPGIELRYQDKIWRMFQTLQPRDAVEGTGIGLALVHKIVTHRGGEVGVESEAGEGATFWFDWPARAPERHDGEEESR